MSNRIVNNYTIESLGGFVLVKHWIVYNDKAQFMGTFFKFRDAKTACLTDNFLDAYDGFLY